MKPLIFKKLLENKVRVVEDFDTVAFDCKFRNYVLSFYARYSDGLRVDTGDFYQEVNGIYNELELTEEQWNELQEIIDNAEFIEQEEEEEAENKGNLYDYYGVKPGDFF